MGEFRPWRTADGPSPPRLLTACFAVFHTSSLTLVAVLALHWADAVGDALAGLDTAVGLALFAVLLALVAVTNRRVLLAVPRDVAGTPRGVGPLLAASAFWGAVTGLAVVALPAIVFAAFLVLSQPLSAALVLALATVVATAIGGAVGLAFAVVDLVLVRAVRALLPRPAAGAGVDRVDAEG